MNGTVGLLVGAITVGLLQLLAGLHPEGLGTNMTLSLAAAFIHTGAVLMGLFSLAAITQLAFASQPSHRFGTLGLSLVALFASFSDLLYIVWFLLPGLVVWGAARWLENRRFANRQLGVALSAAIVGALLGHVYTTSTGTSNPDYGKTLQSAEVIWSNISSGRDIVFAVDLTITLVMGIYLVLAVWRASEERSISKFDFVACLIAAAQIASLALPIVSGQLFDPANVRYCLPVFLLPAIWAVLWASRRAPRLLPNWATGGALASLTVLFLIAWGPQSASAARALGGQSELAKCLIAAGLRDGVTDYWNAKSLIFESNYLLSVVQVADKGELYRWNYNSLWFSRSSDGSRSVAPTFVVLDRLDPAALAKRFGEPTSVSRCGPSVIWAYDHPLSW
jgi:hypothetical protein